MHQTKLDKWLFRMYRVPTSPSTCVIQCDCRLCLDPCWHVADRFKKFTNAITDMMDSRLSNTDDASGLQSILVLFLGCITKHHKFATSKHAKMDCCLIGAVDFLILNLFEKIIRTGIQWERNWQMNEKTFKQNGIRIPQAWQNFAGLYQQLINGVIDVIRNQGSMFVRDIMKFTVHAWASMKYDHKEYYVWDEVQDIRTDITTSFMQTHSRTKLIQKFDDVELGLLTKLMHTFRMMPDFGEILWPLFHTSKLEPTGFLKIVVETDIIRNAIPNYAWRDIHQKCLTLPEWDLFLIKMQSYPNPCIRNLNIGDQIDFVFAK